MWYFLLLLSILLLIKLRDQRLFFSITRIGHTDIPSTKKIDAPSENIKIQDIMAFVFRGLVFGYFAFTLLAQWELIDTSNIPIYLVIGIWLGYTLVKFILEMMIGLLWRSRRLLLEVIVRRCLLKTKAAFLLLIFIFISQYPPISSAIYWAIAGGGIFCILYHWVSILCKPLSATNTQKDGTIYFVYLHSRNRTLLGFIRATQPNQQLIRFYESKNDTCLTTRASD